MELVMPRIPDQLLHCPFYIYQSIEDAKSGKITSGASGVWLSVPLSNNPDWSQEYAVTNSHVIKEIFNNRTTPIIRINTNDGGFDLLDPSATGLSNWVHHPDGSDVAALPIDVFRASHRIVSIPVQYLATKEVIDSNNIGPGDETLMIGRFFNHEGRQRNTPAVRFGNISMMPFEPILDQYGFTQESYLIECRSIPGHSGSPVFTYIPPNAMRPYAFGWAVVAKSSLSKGPWLLGIDWCHMNDKSGQNTGMAGVIPAWKILEVLNLDVLKSMREQADEEATKRKQESTASADLHGEHGSAAKISRRR
jgi:hypothetical protein